MKNIDNLQEQLEAACRFCNPPEPERILYETDNFYVMVSLGPIIEGYLLIVTKEHIGACLNIPDNLFEEFLFIKKKVKRVLLNVYGACLFFEHGKIGTSLTMGEDHKHCLHAHLHCIPTNFQLNKVVGQDFASHLFETMNECYESMKGIDKYLFIEDEVIKTYVPEFKIRKQYLRYKLALSLNHKDRWDWVQNQNWDLINKTIIRLKPCFNEPFI